MADTINCDTHGETQGTFVCNHLSDGNAAGLGFVCNEPSDDEPFPDAWCNDCEVIREAHDGWNDESGNLVTIRMVCCDCYQKIRIRNTQTDVTFEDLEGLRWKCFTCEEWHSGPCLDFTYRFPIYWDPDKLPTYEVDLSVGNLPASFLNEDLCILNGEYFFVRGIIYLPIIGTTETLRWGVWGSLSETNFKKLVAAFDDPERVEFEPMFSWLSNWIAEYDEDTVNLKMYAHIQSGERPWFELEPADHQLAQEYHHGISAERVKEIMARRVSEMK